MGLFSALASLLNGGKSTEPVLQPIEYQGYQIYLEPRVQNGQFGVGARITKGEGDEQKVHHFLRADTLPSRESCEEITLMKAKTAIDQLGDSIFRESH